MNDLSWTILGLGFLITCFAGWLIYKVGYEVGWHEGRDDANARAHRLETQKRREAFDGQ